MYALILACGTGGGHSGAAFALKMELERRGHTAVFMDPYTLISENLSDNVGGAYISMVQRVPWLFAIIYQMGEIYRKLPIRSPVYALNKRMADPLRRYLAEHHFDVILIPHLFPAMIVKAMKEDGAELPPTIYIPTDYTCIPFTEETGCDYMDIPSPRLVDEFLAKGIKPEEILTFGIPVRPEFSNQTPREELLVQIDLDPEKHYILLSGGSMGAGKLYRAAKKLQRFLRIHPDYVLIVVCGTNDLLYNRLDSRYGNNSQMIRLHVVENMGTLMKVSDAILTKPGGLSCTEGAVCNRPIIFVSPIRGCESHNLEFFSTLGLGVNLVNHRGRIGRALELLDGSEYEEQMLKMQREEINPHAAEDICDFAEKLVKERDLQEQSEEDPKLRLVYPAEET